MKQWRALLALISEAAHVAAEKVAEYHFRRGEFDEAFIWQVRAERWARKKVSKP